MLVASILKRLKWLSQSLSLYFVGRLTLSYNLSQIGHCNGLFQPHGFVSDAFTTPLSNAKQTSRSCYAKCISQRFTEGDLNKGENVCIDRCVSKYNEVQKKIGEKLQARGAANASGGSTFSAL